jgi:hypothetical protein
MENSSGSWGWEFVNREGSALQRTGASPRRSSPKTYGAMPKEGVPLSVVVEGITAADTQTGQKAPALTNRVAMDFKTDPNCRLCAYSVFAGIAIVGFGALYYSQTM